MSQGQRVRELFLSAIELPAQEREPFLEQSDSDETVRSRVRRLLAHHNEDTSFLATSIPGALPPTEGQLPADGLGGHRLVDEVGRGGMGIVYRGHASESDPDGAEFVALKILSPLYAGSERTVTRFHQEASIAQRLEHPALVRVYDHGEDQGYHYLVSEFIEGGTLADRKASAMRASECARLLAPIARGLHVAHEQSVVHRDVKPSNILIDQGGHAHLSDFGLATDLREEALTRSGELMGTIHYMSPEQVAMRRQEIDRRTDIYSLGVVLYEMAAGKRPFEGESSAEVLAAILKDSPAPFGPPSDRAARDLQTICECCLQKEPRYRFGNAQSLAEELERVANGQPIVTRPPNVVLRGWRGARRRSRALAIAATVLVLLAAGLAVGSALTPDGRAAVEVGSDVEGARVYARAIDPLSGDAGAAQELGRTPCKRRLAPGEYRFVVANDGDFVELRETIAASEDHSALSVRANPTAWNFDPAKHVRLNAASFVDDEGRAHEIAPLYVDRDEVTNAEYLAFLQATNRPEPPTWRNIEVRDEAWLEWPAAGMSWEDARAFAQWRGMRLPTRWEWLRIACGDRVRAFPWGDEAPDDPVSEWARVGRPATKNASEVVRLYREAMLDPLDATHDQSVEGVRNLLGSVREFSASRARGGDGRPSDTHRLVLGASWATLEQNARLDRTLDAPQSRASADCDIGIRCVRSVHPLDEALEPSR